MSILIKDVLLNNSFFNAHTHAAMTLMRGYSDDLIVMEWLQKKIWPLEEKLTEEDVYWGAKLACLEMIKSGTTFFNDMYWHYHGTAKAVEEMGIRAAISAVFIDFSDKEKAKEQQDLNSKLFEETKKYSDRIQFALGPHTIYSVSTESLLWAKEFADRNNCLIHIHLSESKHEVNDCKKYHGKTPVEYLNDIGFLGPNIIAAHNIWVNEKEINTFGIDAGVIEEGKLADLLLIDLKKPFMVPLHNLVSNLVFSANGSCVDTTICNGKILMQNGKVEGEEEIIEKSAEVARNLVSRV